MQQFGEVAADIWFSQDEVYPSVWRIWEPKVHGFFQANMYLIAGATENLIVDCGMGLSSLRNHVTGFADKPIIAVATHAHVDHVGSFHEFDQRCGHAAEEYVFSQMADKDTLAHLFREISEPVTEPPSLGWKVEEYRIKSAPLTRVLCEGDEVQVGEFRFEVLHLPGHSPGSIGLYDPFKKVFFSGDAVYAGKLVDDVHGASISAYVETMKKLLTLEIAIVFPGHNDPFDGESLKNIASAYIAKNA